MRLRSAMMEIGIVACMAMPAFAVDIQVQEASPERQGIVDLLVSGKIVIGDDIKLSGALNTVVWLFRPLKINSHLNSVGGDNRTGPEVALAVVSFRKRNESIYVTAVVDDGAACESSCSNLFWAAVIRVLVRGVYCGALPDGTET